MLTPEIVRELRKPFAPEQIKWKVQTNPKEGDEWAVVVAYVDARDVAERLDIAAGGDWSNEYAIPQVHAGAHHALECRLTVCGVTRCDVGSVPTPRDGDDATKDLYSDALKRAAVQFGVSSHVYRFPNVKAKVQKFGRSFFLTFKAQDELAELNRHLIFGTRWSKFNEIKVSGDAFGADGKPELFHMELVGAGTSYTPPAVVVEHKPAPQQEVAPQAATDKQRRYIGALMNDLGWHSEYMAVFAEKHKIDLVSMNAGEAGYLIEQMEAAIDEPVKVAQDMKPQPPSSDLIDLPELATAVKALRTCESATSGQPPKFTQAQAKDGAALAAEYAASRGRIYAWIFTRHDGDPSSIVAAPPLEELDDQSLIDLAYATAGL